MTPGLARALAPAFAALLMLLLPPAARLPAAQEAPAAGWIETPEAGRVLLERLREVVVVRPDSLNIRPEPSLRKPPVGLARRGDMLRRTGETFNTDEGRGWLGVAFEGGTGWVAAAFVDQVAPSVDRVERAMRLVKALGAGTAIAARRAPVPEVRAGFVYVGPVGDAGWTFAHDQGRRVLERLPYVKETMYVDSVPEDAKLVADAIDGLVAKGANLVFTTSYGFMDPTIKAAARHPGVVFMHCSGYRTAENAGTYFGREYEARYLAGMVAGGMTESNRIGYVAALPIPEVIRGIDAFALGALSVNPDVEVRVLWTGTWYGPGIEREMAERLLDHGADVLTMHQDSPAVVQAAEQRGRLAIGYHSDMAAFGPRATLTSAVWDWAPLYTKVARDVHEGAWEPYRLWWGLKEGVVRLAPVSAGVPESLRQRVATAERAIREGRLRVFEGTIRDSQGEVRVPSGKVLTDAELLTLDYFVLGVKGDLPAGQQPAATTN